MARYAPFGSIIFFFLLLLVANGPTMVVEARKCESQSHRFKGPCVSKTNCGSVCHNEGFTGGHCRGFRRRCFCTKHC
ncbi:hypothetical protein TanjilG_28179 [Lupinus angustifolius]|uniref:Knottins-like domain-containing protein n=1 Tax=Lupinus angustifolius TaxID=3871 RepID=A0A4P1RFL2_LUPAN|nr:hypothetical protein TanjilG_28179 [Lupinus angustifolius]